VATSRLSPVSFCHARSPIPLRVSSGFSPDSRYRDAQKNNIWYLTKDENTIYTILGLNKVTGKKIAEGHFFNLVRSSRYGIFQPQGVSGA
jgi:hypothetical protein